MKTICLTKTCRLAAAMLLTFSGALTVSSADFPTTMTGLNPAAWWRFNETAASPAPTSAGLEFRTGGENLYSGVIDSANGVVSASTWTHVVGTFNGTIQRLYINGVKVAEVALTSAQIANFQPNKWGQLLIGRTSFLYGGNRFFTGLLDEV